MTKENKPKNGFFNNFLEYSGCLIVLIIFIIVFIVISNILNELVIAVLGEKIYNKLDDFVRILIIGGIAYTYFNAQFQSLNLLFKRIEYLQKTVNSLKETIEQIKEK